MTVRPILFSAPMVRAILREIEAPGTGKTQTRREIKPWPIPAIYPSETQEDMELRGYEFREAGDNCLYAMRPRWQAGDVLWCRETWCPVADAQFGSEDWTDYRATPRYAASHPAGWDAAPDDPDALKWRPSIFMPRNRSRLTLAVEDVRVERLQDISAADAKAEGLLRLPATGRWVVARGDQYFDRASCDPRTTFAWLWEAINGADTWAQNPWVAVIRFRPHLANIDAYLARRASA